MKATTIFAPHRIPFSDRPKVFLAGSIEMGAATEWQSKLAEQLGHLDVVLLNPRRPDWDSGWQAVKTNPQFREQVEWELDGLADADLVVMYLAPNTVSPISLLELGLRAGRSKMLLCCPPEYARKGNVDIVAERHGIRVYEDWDLWVEAIVDQLTPSTL